MQYTKGERKLVYRGQGLGYAVETEDRCIAIFNECPTDHGNQQAKADALLDAAAPRMAEALKEIYEAEVGPDVLRILQPWFSKVEQILASIEGK